MLRMISCFLLLLLIPLSTVASDLHDELQTLVVPGAHDIHVNISDDKSNAVVTYQIENYVDKPPPYAGMFVYIYFDTSSKINKFYQNRLSEEIKIRQDELPRNDRSLHLDFKISPMQQGNFTGTKTQFIQDLKRCKDGSVCYDGTWQWDTTLTGYYLHSKNIFLWVYVVEIQKKISANPEPIVNTLISKLEKIDVEKYISKNAAADVPLNTIATQGESLNDQEVIVATAASGAILTLGALLQLIFNGGLGQLTQLLGGKSLSFTPLPTDEPKTETEPEPTSEKTTADTSTTDSDAGSYVEPPAIVSSNPAAMLPPDIPANPPLGYQAGDKIWYQPPWDKGGPYWMSKKDFDYMNRMQREGKVWSDRMHGFLDKADATQIELDRDRGFEKFKNAIDPQLEKLNNEIKQTQIKIQQLKEDKAKSDQMNDLKEKLINLENEARKNLAASSRMDKLAAIPNAIKIAADLGVAGASIGTSFLPGVGPLIGYGIDKGYSLATGIAGGIGKAIRDGGNLGSHLAQGTLEGGKEALTKIAVDGALRGIIKGGTALKGAFGGGVKTSATLSGELAASKVAVEKALASGKEKDIIALLQKGGMKNLSKLEESGHLSAQEANKINRLLTNKVNDAIKPAVTNTMHETEKKMGVKIEEAHIGDSGSSAKGGPRSIKTDADRTSVLKLEQQSLERYAKDNNLSLSEAHNKVSGEFANRLENNINRELGKNGLTNKDVDLKVYNGIGSKAGPADSYPEGFTRTRQAVQGETTIFSERSGMITSRRATGQTLIDQADLNLVATKGRENVGDIAFTSGFSRKEVEPLLREQAAAIEKATTVKDVAKTFTRTNYFSELAGRTTSNPHALGVAEKMLQHPQDAARILYSHGYTKEIFMDAGKEAVNELVRK